MTLRVLLTTNPVLFTQLYYKSIQTRPSVRQESSNASIKSGSIRNPTASANASPTAARSEKKQSQDLERAIQEFGDKAL